MDEDEYEDYLHQIGLSDLEPVEKPQVEQLRDEQGYRIPGCHRVNPAPPER